MKKILTLLFLAISVSAHGTVDPTILTVSYADLAGTAELQPGTPVNKTDVDKNKNDVVIVITGVIKESDMADFAFSTTEKSLNTAVLNPLFDGTKKTYTVTITPVINAMAAGASTAFIIKNKAGNKRWSLDITTVQAPTVSNQSCSQNEFQAAAQHEFDLHILPNMQTKFGLKDRNGLYLDTNHIVHIFVDHFGKYYGHAAPTVATERYLYQVHLITAACLQSTYSFDFTGAYNPQFNIDSHSDAAKAVSSGSSEIKILVIDYAVIGPFTDKFTFNVTRTVGSNKSETIVNPTIPVAKLFHVSVTTGLLATTLKNPQNISKSPLAKKGDSTLVADDPGARGLLSIMAIYYPEGRSFLYPPSGGPFDASRLGIVVGTQVGQTVTENFLIGLSNDFARGGSFTYGLHFGRRNFVEGSPNFKYGTDVFSAPALVVKKQWNVGFFFGVSVDTRVALQLIKSLGSSL